MPRTDDLKAKAVEYDRMADAAAEHRGAKHWLSKTQHRARHHTGPFTAGIALRRRGHRHAVDDELAVLVTRLRSFQAASGSKSIPSVDASMVAARSSA
jgi:hypothetical protein